MGDTYKGESPSKKAARLAVWRHVRARLGESRFCVGPHLVIASREGGDIGVLLALGAKPDGIVAAELDQQAAEACAKKWPNVEVVHGDVGTVARLRGLPWASAFLDFCGCINRLTVDAAAATLNEMPYGSVFAVAILRGRENDSLVARGNRAARRCASAKLRRYGDGAMSVAAALGAVGTRTAVVGTGRDVGNATLARRVAFNANLYARSSRRLLATACFEYQSSDARSGGSPMLILVSTVETEKAFHFHMRGDGPDTWPLRIRETDASIKKLALALGEDAPRLLNLPASTVAAWRAHATRGTYDKETAA